jgi:hypothetical protein
VSQIRAILQNPLQLRALVLGTLTGVALVLVAVFSTRGPLMFLPYTALFCALAPLLARYRSETFFARAGAAFLAFLTASVVSYLYIRLVANPGLPSFSFIGLVRFALVVGSGGVLAAAIAFVTGGDNPKRVGSAA